MRHAKIIILMLTLVALSACGGRDVKTDTIPAGPAADFSLTDQDGKIWTLTETLKNHRGVVLAFYPKDNTGL
ncbi:MAG: redoxin domain-containing protein [Smithella sp.]|jgi:major membrane immunogen (membrane-anchored lipoprotein)|nr:redoxin domain-containing protein [Smithella sp.]